MKKLAIILGSTSLLGAGGAWAAISCTPTPDCYDLGYTSSDSDCSGDYVRCPFDPDSVFCVEVPDQCTELGYTKVATNGNYTCPDGQSVSKCATNTKKYKCDGTACSSGYYTWSNMPDCPYSECCRKRATYGNTNCYTWMNNASYKNYTIEYAQCRAASWGACFGTRTRYSGSGSSTSYIKDACDNYTFEAYEDTYDCYYESNSNYLYSGYNGEGSAATCYWLFGDLIYNECGDTSDPDCYNPKNYTYNGQSVTFATMCYNKYKISISCGGIKYTYIDSLPNDVDNYERL